MEAIAHYLRAAPAPVAAKRLLKDLRIAPAQLDAALHAGIAFEWPKFRGAVRVWRVAAAQIVREAALAPLANQAVTTPELIRMVAAASHNAGAKLVRATVASLIAEGAIAVAKVVGTTALCYSPRHPQALASVCHALVDERLRKLGIGAPPADLLATIRSLEKGPSVPVPVYEIRARSNVSKPDFDRAILALADSGAIYLTTHDHGWALPEAERERLVWDGGGKLYVAVTLRA